MRVSACTDPHATKRADAAAASCFALTEALLKEERDIEAELGAFEQRRARWEDESSSRSASAHVRRAAWAGSSSARPASASSVAAPHGAAAIAAARAQDDTPPEVRAYEAFVAQRGRLGGWDEEDHEMFMKQLKAVGGDYSAVVARAEERLPHIPKEQVLAHARWHAEHEDMLAERRAAIQRWRLRRDMARLGGAKPKRGAKAFGFGSRAPPADEDEDVDTATVAEMELAAQDARRMAAEMKRAEVRAWREEKAAQTARAAQEEERRERRRKEQAERARSSNAVRREAARLYRAEREAQQAAARAREQEEQAEQRATRPKLSKENAMRMHERDLRMAQRKEAATRAKEEEVEARRRRQARLKASVREEVDKKVKADAGRLMRPTSAHMRRTEEGRESRGLFDNGVTNVRYHSVKATPSWRQMR